MKMNKLITTATVLALIGLASVGTASAQTFNQGDLLLAFRINDGTGTGAGTSLEYDLGAGASFNFASSNASIVNLSSDLNSVYGSTWASRSDLVWSVVGSTSSTNYFSNPGNALTVTTTSPLPGGTGAGSIISSIYAGSNNGTLETSAYALANSTSGSYDDVLTNVNGFHGNGQAYTTDYNQAFAGIGATETTLGGSSDLYKQVPAGSHPTTAASSTDEGTFEVGTNGVLSFTTPAAVPEPASYALGGIAAALFVIMHRRSKIRA